MTARREAAAAASAAAARLYALASLPEGPCDHSGDAGAQALCCGSAARLATELRTMRSLRVDVDVLHRSRVAKAVKPLRSHGCPGVATLARELFAEWKAVAAAEMRRTAPQPAAAAGDASPRPPMYKRRRHPPAVGLVRTMSGDERARTQAARAQRAAYERQERADSAELAAVLDETDALAAALRSHGVLRRKVPARAQGDSQPAAAAPAPAPAPAAGGATAPAVWPRMRDMAEPPGAVIRGPVFRFWSSAKEGASDSDCRLSNLRQATVEFRGALYPTSEHAYQAAVGSSVWNITRDPTVP